MMALWLGLPKWGRDALTIFGAIVLAIITGKFIIARHDDRIRKEVNDARDREADKAEQQVITNIQENTDEVIREADAVREHTSASVLPDGGAALEPHHYRD